MADFLSDVSQQIRRELTACARIGANMVEADIEAREHDCNAAQIWSANRERIKEELELTKPRRSEARWCREELGPGNSYQQMRKRVQLLQGFGRYLQRRQEVGANGLYSLDYAVFLARSDNGSDSRRTGVLSAGATLDPSRVQVVTGDALNELRKMETGSANVIVTSPPYWPARRDFGSLLGFEPTLREYLRNLIRIFREARRVLSNDGSLWVIMDDARSHATSYDPNKRYHGRRSDAKMQSQQGFQPPTPDLPPGNLLFVPAQFGMAMQKDGWIARDEIIWNKGQHGRKEAVTNRTRRNYEEVMMFTKKPYGYYYNPDPLRIPLVRDDMLWWRPGVNNKPGVLRYDRDRFVAIPHPLGRIADAVWNVRPDFLPGSSHAATFPSDLVQMILAVACPDDGLVVDPFGGVGTVAKLALQMGFRAISIDLNPTYSEEARQRLSKVCADEIDCRPANDNQRDDAVAD
jgi:site-specific DNA-methyltransferase (cytosine-N4-specific)